jgi:hypothetical protein
MSREAQVRICEGLGVKLPGPTRQERRFAPRPPTVRCSTDSGHMLHRRELALGANCGLMHRNITAPLFNHIVGRIRIDGGRVRPRVLAVLRLITSSNLVGT